MIEVYKYGGNLLKDEKIRKEIYAFLKKKVKERIKVIMVVSAMGREKDCFSTDNLSQNINLLNNKEKDLIMTFGEIYSSLIIKNELLNEGVKVESVNYDEIGILCDNNYQDGNIIDIDMSLLKKKIKQNDIVIVPGFIGQSKEGRIISLGRNTSDLTAIIIAKQFNLDKANIIKEVDGVFKKDPKKEQSKLINKISYDEINALLEAGSKLFSKKTIEYAKNNGIVIEIKGMNKDKGSIVSFEKSGENIIFVNKENDEVKVVFENMEIFNELFKSLVEEKIKLEDLVVVNNIVYLKENENKIMEIINKYL